MDKSAKHGFVSNFLKHGKGNDMSWVQEYCKRESNVERWVSGVQSGWYNRNQILKLKEFDPKDFTPEEKDEMVGKIIKMSEEELQYTSKKCACAEDDRLSTFFFLNTAKATPTKMFMIRRKHSKIM